MKHDNIYRKRLDKHMDELKWLYMELYNSQDMFDGLLKGMEGFYKERAGGLRALDAAREEDPCWYRKSSMLGMMMYADHFAGSLKGVEGKLDYIAQCHVKYLHLMPLLDTPRGRSDGGYAVSDFRKVREDLGTMEDLEQLAHECHDRGISLCLDFVMNHTSEDHGWAKRARAGEKEYQDRYFFFDSWTVPSMFEETVPQVFPATAPGNFTCLPETGQYVMTTFYPYQWDLNYRNSVVFNEMMFNFLYLANRGVDVLRIDAVPYIWKELGTDCRNLPRVHTIVRMMRMIGEIVCPGILLLGEVVMEPEKVAPYFGTVEKPECHMLYNVTMMATTWNTVATRDTRLLRMQLDIMNNLPKEYTFLNYLRCHDDIGWGLDFQTLAGWGMQEVPHKRYLNDFFTGKIAESVSRGELYNEDPITGDARFCATTASMCGIESAGFEQNEEKKKRAVRFDLMLHAYMMVQSGIPMLYSGDEIGQVNDYTYKNDPEKRVDSRYIHRGKFDWKLADGRKRKGTVQKELFDGIGKLRSIRSKEKVFDASANVWTLDTWENGILGVVRELEGEQMTALFNFAEEDRTAWIEEEGEYMDLYTGKKVSLQAIKMEGHSFVLAKKC